MDDILAMDFGTSNSAVAIYQAGVLRRLALDGAADTLPTAVFFPADTQEMLIGHAAVSALIAGEEGRFMRALKSILGTSLFHESRLIAGKRRSLQQIVTAFIAETKQRAEAAAGRRFARVLSGRPVHFHSADAARDARAEEDLRACYLAAGFSDVAFMYEPEAAAHAAAQTDGSIGLIVDIGGGTSDFTLYRAGGAGGLEIIASHGIRLGGTDFDQAVSMHHVMPLLGQGGELRRQMGEGLLPVPNGIFLDLATWAKIPFLYTRDTQRAVDDLVKFALKPRRLQRLAKVISDELGHHTAFEVEKGKIAANGQAQATAFIDLGAIEPRLVAGVDADSLRTALAPAQQALVGAITATLQKAGMAGDEVSHVVLVGGSSLLAMVRAASATVLPHARQIESEAFTAVVDGLAIASARVL